MSQDEIDALLRSMAGNGGDGGSSETAAEGAQPAEPGATEPAGAASVSASAASAYRSAPKKPDKKYKLYDFKNPKLFSKEQIRMVTIIYDNYSKHLSSFMSGKLRAECTISINAIEEQRYYEYNNALPESMMMGVFDVSPLEGNMLIEVDEETAYLIIEKLLGWVGEKPLVSNNDFTDIEIKIFEKFFIEISTYLKEAWANVTDLEPRFNRIETNARLTQIMPIDEVVILIMLTVKINDYEGKMSICVPCLNLQALLDQSDNYQKIKRKKNIEDMEKAQKDIFTHLKASRIDVRGVLGNTTLNLHDLLYLQVGDVLPLDSSKDSLITLKVGSLDWYQGEIGVKKNRMAVKIINELQAKKELQKIL